MKLWIAREKWESPISGLSFQVNDESFPEVTFENSPIQVELDYVMNGL
jgi:hypothetical protein